MIARLMAAALITSGTGVVMALVNFAVAAWRLLH